MYSTEYQKLSDDILDCILNWLTDEIDDKASPRKPNVITWYKSSKFLILEVEYFFVAKSKSSFAIPLQLSVIIISEIHHSVISIVIVSAQASIEFSTNSFITETGLSTTSPAAIWFARVGSSWMIFHINV